MLLPRILLLLKRVLRLRVLISTAGLLCGHRHRRHRLLPVERDRPGHRGEDEEIIST